MSVDRKEGQNWIFQNFRREGFPGETAQIVSVGFVPFTQIAFPHFSKAHPDVVQLLEESRIKNRPAIARGRLDDSETTVVSLRYKTKYLSEKSFLLLAGTPLPAETLIKTQRGFAFSSKEVKKVPSRWSRQQMADCFTPKDLEPDFQYGEPQAYKDPWANTLFAVNLVLGMAIEDTNKPLQNLEDLNKYAQDKECTLYRDDLRMAFIGLVSDNSIDLLMEKGVLKKDGLEHFYQGVSDWLVDLSGIKEAAVLNASPYPFFEELTPRPDFLPYLVRTFHQYFLNDVHHRMAPEEIYNNYEKLNKLIDRSLRSSPNWEGLNDVKKNILAFLIPLRDYVMPVKGRVSSKH